MSAVDQTAGIPADLVATGERLVTEATEALRTVARLSGEYDTLCRALDAHRPELPDVEADDALLEEWCKVLGVRVLQTVLNECAVAIMDSTGSLPWGDAEPNVDEALAGVEAWRAAR